MIMKIGHNTKKEPAIILFLHERSGKDIKIRYLDLLVPELSGRVGSRFLKSIFPSSTQRHYEILFISAMFF